MNIYDISQKSGVSIATVSRVLNGSDHVSPQTREKVLRVMAEENYTPNAFARGLGLNTMRTIGILYTDPSDLYLANAVYYLGQAFREKGYDCLLCCSGYDLADRQKYVDWLLSKKVDAIILTGSYYVEECDLDNSYIRQAAQRVPVGILSGQVEGENICCALCDDYQAAYQMADSLLRRNADQILFLYHAMSDSVRHKIAGIRDAHQARGRVFRDKYAVLCPHRDIDACRDYIRTLRGQLTFDAVMSTDDLLAAAALKFAQDAGLQVPEQLRIVGYNDSVLARCCTPALTTVDNHVQQLCTALVDMLLENFAGNHSHRCFKISGTPVFRGST